MKLNQETQRCAEHGGQFGRKSKGKSWKAAGEVLIAITTWSEKLDQDITTGVQGLNEIYTFMSAVHEEQVERVRKYHLALEKRALREKFTNIYTKQLEVTKTYHY